MMLPSIFGESLFDSMIDDMFPRFERMPIRSTNDLMKTDIKEKESTYELLVELPGFKKEDVKAQLKDGYLTISVSNEETEEENGKYVRRERYFGQMSRSYFVGEGMRDEDISCRFDNGILHIELPKEEPKKIDDTKYLEIK